jgi:RHS repeat-associated protein
MDLKEYLHELEYLVNTDSGSDNPEGLNKMADYFAERFDALGWRVDRHDLAPESGSCLIITNREAEHYDLMLMGHLDTVQPVGFAKEHPFTVEEDLIHGPGTCDMKAGCLCGLYAVKELDEETGLYYYGARYYDPKTSLWLSTDHKNTVKDDKSQMSDPRNIEFMNRDKHKQIHKNNGNN